ncbi:hypothetical protein J7E93_10455 [Streptomyces sp. ISL-36]|nr:hypothetical protein [Streptomyces sp. ISL-36]MBT2440525.1 hypothetical protein [Streptomyces sp. ISL-36]
MEAVDGEFGGLGVVPQGARLGDLGQQTLDQVDELLLGLADGFALVEEGREFIAVVAAVVGDEGVRREYGFEPLGRAAGGRRARSVGWGRCSCFWLLPSSV